MLLSDIYAYGHPYTFIPKYSAFIEIDSFIQRRYKAQWEITG